MPTRLSRPALKWRRKPPHAGRLEIKATLASARLAVDAPEAEALSKLNAQYRALYGTEDFKEGRKAEAEGRPPVYQGR